MTEQQIRNRLKKLGYSLHKDRAKTISGYHLGGYNVIDNETNAAVQGGNYSWSLEDIENWLKSFTEDLKDAEQHGNA